MAFFDKGAARRLGAALIISGGLHLLFLAGMASSWLAEKSSATMAHGPLQVAFRIVGGPAAETPPAPRLPADTEAKSSAPLVGQGHDAPVPVTTNSSDLPRYYLLHELDVPPFAQGELPEDPPELRPYNEAGRLLLELWIDNAGAVVRVEQIDSDLPAVFFQQARTAFMGLPFVPAQKAGQAVAARIRVVLEYQKRYEAHAVR